MTKRKIGRRWYVTVTQGDKVPPHARVYSNEPIYTLHQHFHFRQKHLKGSNRPAGWFHGNSYDGSVHVRWLWTESNRFFAPEITFCPRAVKIASKVAHALNGIYLLESSPDELCLALKAFEVEYVTDEKDGCWDDYRLLRDYTENAMMTLARAAQ
jgi:hypothetical protein